MRMPARCKYALQAIMVLAKVPAGSVLKVADIASGPDIPAEYLVQVLIMLKNAGIVESVRGKVGGYRLSRLPEQTTVAEVLEAVEGGRQPIEGLSSAFVNVLQQANDAAHAVLAEATFADLLRQEREKQNTVSYTI